MGFAIFLDIFAFLSAHFGAWANAGEADTMPRTQQSSDGRQSPNRFDTSDAPYKRAAVLEGRGSCVIAALPTVVRIL